MEGMYKVCDVKLTYNTKVKSSERAVIKDSNSAYSLLMNHIYDSETIQYREYMKLILLNNAKGYWGLYIYQKVDWIQHLPIYESLCRLRYWETPLQ